ncbi:Semaphorin-3G [Manis pentadactyla]|nr:Semaphorin-3G [Manis pentadactyla]
MVALVNRAGARQAQGQASRDFYYLVLSGKAISGSYWVLSSNKRMWGPERNEPRGAPRTAGDKESSLQPAWGQLLRTRGHLLANWAADGPALARADSPHSAPGSTSSFQSHVFINVLRNETHVHVIVCGTQSTTPPRSSHVLEFHPSSSEPDISSVNSALTQDTRYASA